MNVEYRSQLLGPPSDITIPRLSMFEMLGGNVKPVLWDFLQAKLPSGFCEYYCTLPIGTSVQSALKSYTNK